jgi:hypothetical protein
MAFTLSLPALAQELPRLFPSRDVAVTYRVSGAGPMQEVTMAWAAAPRLMRVELPGMGYTIADFAGQKGFMVMQMPQLMVMDIPMAQAASHVRALESARFTKLGAGLARIAWQVLPARIGGMRGRKVPARAASPMMGYCCVLKAAPRVCRARLRLCA